MNYYVLPSLPLPLCRQPNRPPPSRLTRHCPALRSVAEAAAEDARLLESEKRETLKSHVLLEARRARLTAELQVTAMKTLHDTLGFLLPFVHVAKSPPGGCNCTRLIVASIRSMTGGLPSAAMVYLF